MKKKFVPIIALSTGILFSSVVNAEEKYFTDITEAYTYYDEITYLLGHNIIDASKGEFLPEKQATREEIVVMIAKALGLDGTQRETDFADIPKSHPSSGYIQSAAEAGIVNGYSDGTFQLNTHLSRGHMAVFIARAFDLQYASDKSFSDVRPNSPAYEAIHQLAYYGITTGYGDGTFKPNLGVTKEHVAIFLTRTLRTVGLPDRNTDEHTQDREFEVKSVTTQVDLGSASVTDYSNISYKVDAETGEFEAIVMYKNEKGRQYALKKGTEVKQATDLSSMNIIVVKVSETVFKDLQKNNNIQYVERNLIMEVEQESFNMTDFGDELLTQVKSNEYAGWGYGYMNIKEAYNKGITGKGVKIAVADSGVSKHPDLKVVEHVYPNDNKVNLYDSDGHGSHIAGIINAKDNNEGAIGIAPNAEIYSIKMEDDAGSMSSYQFLLALEWAIENKIDLFNASIGFNLNSPIFQAAINRAYEQGLIVVAATGNDGAENIRYPASYDNVIAVGAVTPNNERDVFSNYGDKLDFVAPGKRIAGVSYQGGYITKTGTSMAAPHIVGLLALLMEEFPDKTAEWYLEALKDMSVDCDIKGYDKNTGYGAPKYNPSKINQQGGDKEDKGAVSVEDLPMDQQRYYKLIESYLQNIEFATGSYKEHFLDEAEKNMDYIDSSPVKDKLLEILHKNGRLQDEKYSTGVKYEEKDPTSVSDLTKKEQNYYNDAFGYLEDIAKVKTEREFNRLLGKIENLISKIQSSPIRDTLLGRVHYYGGALNIPYYDGSYYKGQVVGFVPSTPPVVTDPEIEQPKPGKPTPEDMTGKETDVSQLPKVQQDYYNLAQSHITQATTSAGESHLNKAVTYVLMINNSPVRDVLLRQLHQYGRLLDVPYSTGLYYYGDIDYTPWKPALPVLPPEQTKPEVPTTPPSKPDGGVTSNDRPSIEVPTAKQRYIENLFNSIKEYPEITSYRTRAEEVINDLPDSIEKDEYLRRLNEL